jgi:ankyrin repeat protein
LRSEPCQALLWLALSLATGCSAETATPPQAGQKISPQGSSGAHHHHDTSTPPTTGAAALLLEAYSGPDFATHTLALYRAQGADIDARNEDQETLLIQAARRGDVPWLKALLAAGANFELRDHHGWSALNHAINGGHAGAALALIEGGLPVDVADMHENSPLQYAVNLLATPEVVRALVAGGADVNRLSQHGHSVLMEAIDAGNPLATIETLLAAPGVKLDYVDREGLALLDHARELGDASIIAAITQRLATGSTTTPGPAQPAGP